MSADQTARRALWYLSFFGYATAFTIRLTLNIAIVAMVLPRPVQAGRFESECFSSINFTQGDNATSLKLHDGFAWDEKQQGMVLGSFFWLFWLAQIPGGVLAQIYGGKNVYGLSHLACSLLCFLVPMSANYNIYALMFIRFLQGIFTGFQAPATHSLAGRWIPPNERSHFVTVYLGGSIGAAIAFVLQGLLIDLFGWESVFHVSGAVGVAWYVAWHFFAFDSPSDHPRISPEEKEYILKSLGQNTVHKKLKTPWKALLTSFPFWINVVAQWANFWGLTTTFTMAPTYLRWVHGLDIKVTGVMSGVPHLGRVLVGVLSSKLADYLLKEDKMSRTNVRKLFTALATLGQAVFIVGTAYSGCNSVAAVTFLALAVAAQGPSTSGSIAALVDIAPNFAGISLGVATAIGALSGFISPTMFGALTYNNQTAGQWQIAFLITAGIVGCPGLIYIFFNKSEVQSWNSPATCDENKEESKSLNEKVSS